MLAARPEPRERSATNDSVAGFMTSIVIAMARTTSGATC